MSLTKDNIKLGAILGLLLPPICMGIFSVIMRSNFDSYDHMFNHFQLFNIWYKVLSVSLMPGAGLFFLWSKTGKINQARGVLMMTLFYGVFVMILYFG